MPVVNSLSPYLCVKPTPTKSKHHQEEVLSRLILCGEGALQHALKEYVTHDHEERPHQGKGHIVLFPGLR